MKPSEILKFLAPKKIVTVRAASKEQRKADKRYNATHKQLANELGIEWKAVK